MKKIYKSALKVLIGIIAFYVLICVGYFAWIGFNSRYSELVLPPLNYGERVNGTAVSMINLISTPEKYNGKTVIVLGVVHIERDGVETGSTIYLSKDDYKYGITKNSLWIYPNYKTLKTDYKELSKFNGKYVIIEGRFNKDKLGTWGLYSGTIDDVISISFYENKAFQAKQ